MSIKTIGLYSVLVPLLMLVTSVSLAQRPLRRYQPPGGPTLSRYLDYSRADLSTMPSAYGSFVVPQQQLQRNLYDLSRTQQADFRKVEREVKEFRRSTAAPTGVGATFLNYSHYYQFQQGGSYQR